MARIAPLDHAARADLAALTAQIGAERGRVSPLYATLLHTPGIAAGWLGLLTAVREQSSLPAFVREIVVLRIAVLHGNVYQQRSHVSHARAAGVSEEQIEALGKMDSPGPLPDELAAIVAYTDAVTRDVEVPDDVFEAVLASLGERQVLDLTITIAAYNMVSRVVAALEIGT